MWKSVNEEFESNWNKIWLETKLGTKISQTKFRKKMSTKFEAWYSSMTSSWSLTSTLPAMDVKGHFQKHQSFAQPIHCPTILRAGEIYLKTLFFLWKQTTTMWIFNTESGELARTNMIVFILKTFFLIIFCNHAELIKMWGLFCWNILFRFQHLIQFWSALICCL